MQEVLNVELVDALSGQKFVELLLLLGRVFGKALLVVAVGEPVLLAYGKETIDAQLTLERCPPHGAIELGFFHWRELLTAPQA